MGKQARLRALEQAENPRPNIVITGEFLSNNTIFMAMGEILRGHYNQDVAFQIEKLSRRLNQTQRKFVAASEEILKKYTNLDEKGQPKRKMEPKVLSNGELELAPKKNADGTIEKDANGAPVMEQVMVPVDFDWKDIDDKDAEGNAVKTNGKELAEMEFAELGKTEYTLDVYKFDRHTFSDVKLTVAQWMSLNPLFVDPYETTEEA